MGAGRAERRETDVRQMFEPVLTTEPRPDPADRERTLYLRSYLVMRTAVGVLGIAMPFVIVLVDGLWLDGRFPRDSLSAYYYSGVRDVFVGVLCATAVFLVTYKVVERNLDNFLSIVAGIAALVVALFPTGPPSDLVPLTPLQMRLGETFVKTVHFAAAGVFILALGIICITFGVREGKRSDRNRRQQRFWRRFHWGCATVIGLAVLFILVVDLGLGWDRALLVGEVAAVWAFGASWLMKGLELDALRRPRSP